MHKKVKPAVGVSARGRGPLALDAQENSHQLHIYSRNSTARQTLAFHGHAQTHKHLAWGQLVGSEEVSSQRITQRVNVIRFNARQNRSLFVGSVRIEHKGESDPVAPACFRRLERGGSAKRLGEHNVTRLCAASTFPPERNSFRRERVDNIFAGGQENKDIRAALSEAT